MDSSQLRKNRDLVLEDIQKAAVKSGRNIDDIILVAVSKTHPASMVSELFKHGQAVFGENYVQEATAKIDELQDLEIDWHFIGHLQSNKAAKVVGRFSLIQTVHSLKLANRMNKLAGEKNIRQPVLVQINPGDEDQKSGVRPDQAEELCSQIIALESLDLQGLMLLPPFFDDGEKSRPYFKRLRLLKESLEKSLDREFKHLSMGMTADFKQAIEEGATLIRVGTRIFGPREYCR
ncbi:MAG: YggS family pyridoxal phosphate-dependent enzyme [Thermodesulfobacteriota bacterium]